MTPSFDNPTKVCYALAHTLLGAINTLLGVLIHTLKKGIKWGCPKCFTSQPSTHLNRKMSRENEKGICKFRKQIMPLIF
jgi:hypothetical protein